MALTIFLVVSGLAVVFLLYVLVNFWKDGHRSRPATRGYSKEYIRSGGPRTTIPSEELSQASNAGFSVIAFPAASRPYAERVGRAVASREILVVRAKRASRS